MSKIYKRIRNTGKHPAIIIYEGDRVDLPAGAEDLVPLDKAELYLARYPASCIEVSEDPITYGGVVESTFGVRTVWLANMTGNPNEPEKKRRKVVRNKAWENEEITNPNRMPQTLRREMDGGMAEAEDGESRNLGKITLEIKPYSRVQWPEYLATWFSNRDANMSPECTGQVVVSRAPHPDDPALDWDLDDLRQYYEMATGNQPSEPAEEKLRKKHKEDKAFTNAVFEAKKELVRKLFFIVADAAQPQFTRKDFEAYKRGGSESAVSPAEANKLLEAQP